MKNERSITINVIQNNIMCNNKLAKYFANKYRKELRKMQLQKS